MYPRDDVAIVSGSDNMRDDDDDDDDDDSEYDSSISDSVSEKDTNAFVSSSKNQIEQKKLDDAHSKLSKKNSSDAPKIDVMPVEKGGVPESDDEYEKVSNLDQPLNKSYSQLARKLDDAHNMSARDNASKSGSGPKDA